MTRIRLDHIQKNYDSETVAVRDLCLDIPPSEFLVLVGPSGCGKSTVLRMIAGLEDISEGELRFDEQRMNEVEARNRDIGMVFQNYALYPHMTVFENLAFPLRVHKESTERIRARVHEVAEMLSITVLLERLPKQLSGGQRQRVALGRAIVRQPRVFLFDEPLSNLDARLRIEMRAELTQLQKRLGTTSVYVTHDHVEAMTMGQRIAVLRHGELMQVGRPQELYSNPDNDFVASFLGSPGMNFFQGQLVMENGLHFIDNLGLLKFPVQEKQFRSGVKNLQRPVKVGLRSEDIIPAEEANAQFEALVEVVEYVGHESLLYFRIGTQLHCSRSLSSYRQHPSTAQGFRINPAAVFLFDADGIRL